MTQTTTIRTGHDAYKLNKQAIEGPTRRQAVKMAEYRRRLLALAAETSDGGQAFEWDCEAFDVESDLVRYGFNVETGKPVR